MNSEERKLSSELGVGRVGRGLGEGRRTVREASLKVVALQSRLEGWARFCCAETVEVEEVG